MSDLLTCPRCGPRYGLILLPYEAADRRVVSGVLGCANCRERYPVAEGVADLRMGEPPSFVGTSETTFDAVAGAEEQEAVRLAGLMGLAEARGTVLLAGPAAAHAAAVSALVEGVEVVAVLEGTEPGPAAGVTRLRVTARLPFRDGSLRGVALTGPRVALVAEGARVLGREGRLVLDPAPEAARSHLGAAGLTVLAEERGVMVAARRG
ncbi:MAG: hypothetical protein R3314_09375 [Longimicrobiales bacterium]|nr:hypothetical protein [Longimicrobiales bacterium]